MTYFIICDWPPLSQPISSLDESFSSVYKPPQACRLLGRQDVSVWSNFWVAAVMSSVCSFSATGSLVISSCPTAQGVRDFITEGATRVCVPGSPERGHPRLAAPTQVLLPFSGSRALYTSSAMALHGIARLSPR